MDPGNPERRGSVASTVAGQRLSGREFIGANRFGAIIGAIGGAIGVCVGVAVAVIALIPSSALWMSGIVCISGYRLAHSQRGQSVSFYCANGDSSYDVGDFAAFGLQSVLAALVLCAGLTGIGLLRARLRKP